MSLEFALCLATLLFFAGIGTPIGHSTILAGLVYLAVGGQDIALAAEQALWGLYDSFVLLAVPLFIAAANIMNAGTISDRLLAWCVACVGRFRGGLGHVNVVASLIFSGMSGSAIADAAGIGKIIINMMTKGGRYPAGYAAAITAASATIGPIIPPSIPMVMYSLISDQSIGYLFLGGILPGLFIGAVLMALNAVIATRRNMPKDDPIPLKKMPGMTLNAFPALMMPVILLWGIYGGVTTPTEGAAVAAAYALDCRCPDPELRGRIGEHPQSACRNPCGPRRSSACFHYWRERAAARPWCIAGSHDDYPSDFAAVHSRLQHPWHRSGAFRRDCRHQYHDRTDYAALRNVAIRYQRGNGYTTGRDDP